MRLVDGQIPGRLNSINKRSAESSEMNLEMNSEMNSEENPEENSESNSENNLLNLIVNKASAHLNLNRRARVVISAKMRVRSGCLCRGSTGCDF